MQAMELGYYGAKLIASFEFPHGIQTRPERDALGIPTIMGMTRLPNGQKVRMDMDFSEDEIVKMYRKTKQKFVDAVNLALRISVNQHQFDALVSMAYNVGVSAFSDENNNSVLRYTNLGEFENAAAAFGRWVYGTLRGGKKGPDGGAARGPDDQVLMPGQVWKKAFGGLYRRHISQALLYLSLDWERAAHPQKIKLTKRTEERSFGFYDVVTFKTPWTKIKEDAKYDTLPPDPISISASEPVLTDPVIEESMPELPRPEKSPPETPKRPPQPYRDYDPKAPEKDIAFSKRVWGFVLLVWGWFQTGILLVAELPIVSELASMSPLSVGDWRIGLLIIMAGLLLMWVGKVTAKGPLK